jgi:septum formation protein
MAAALWELFRNVAGPWQGVVSADPHPRVFVRCTRMLLLASASPARRRLLEQAGIAHCVRVSGVDEEAITDPEPRYLVQRLAAAKAEATMSLVFGGEGQQGWSLAEEALEAVLGCDSVLAFEGETFGKPRDAEEAAARWRRMAGRWGELHTGHCLVRPQGRLVETVTTRVLFAPLDDAEIQAYVATGEPLACAGGFALEGRGGLVVERIEGCFSNVIGLSLPLLRRWLS